MHERSWLFPSIAVTLVAGAAALMLIPTASGLLLALKILPAWMGAAMLVSCLYGFTWMMLNGIWTEAPKRPRWPTTCGRSIPARASARAGISAMPSMHVTISSWVVIVFHVFARRWLPVALAAWVLIVLLSISLGWHYALDGIVGTAAALVCHFALLAVFRMKQADVRGSALAMQAGTAAT